MLPARRQAVTDPALPAPPVYLDSPPERSQLPVSHYIWLIRRSARRILAFVTICTAAALIYTARMTPYYESTVTIDVDRRAATDVLGRDRQSSAPVELDQFLASQVRLLQADSVLRPVAEQYRLLERPGEAPSESAKEREEFSDSPVILTRLRVTRPPNTHLLLVSYRSPDRKLAADVANGVAQSFLEHSYRIRYKEAAGLSRFMEKQLEELRAKMEQSSGALGQFERELNIVTPEEKTNILSTRLIDLNSEFTRAHADRLKKEAAYQSLEQGLEEAAQVSSQKEALKKLTEDFHGASQRFAEIRSKFGGNHPEFKAAAARLEETRKLLNETEQSISKRVEVEFQEAAAREQMFAKAVAATKSELDRLNSRSFQYQNLKREAEGDKKLYEELLRRIKEETINSSFQGNSIRIADPARPGRKPVSPSWPLNVSLAFVLSSLLAVGTAVALDIMDDTVREPEDVARTFGADVIGSLPQVKQWGQQGVILAAAHGVLQPGGEHGHLSSYEEAIRSLRNSILLRDFERRIRTLMLTSTTPSEGKSTAAAHLALAHAQQGHRTLLVDGDLRRPAVHQRFGIENNHGISDVITAGANWREMVSSPASAASLHILTAGPASPRKAADFLGPCLARIMDEAYTEYDLIILDAPPLLGFPECLQMATSVDGVVVVAKAGDTSRKGVGAVLSTLEKIGATVLGVVLNQVHQDLSKSYYYYGYYGKYHGHYSGRDANG